MTGPEFAKGYAARSGVTIEWLKQHGREAIPCHCGEEECEGWQMGHVIEEHIGDSGVSYPVEG